MKQIHITHIILFLSIFFLATGFCDLDAEFMAMRFSEWWRNTDYWEFCPFMKVNWWTAYIFSLMRIVTGSFLLGVFVAWLGIKQKNR